MTTFTAYCPSCNTMLELREIESMTHHKVYRCTNEQCKHSRTTDYFKVDIGGYVVNGNQWLGCYVLRPNYDKRGR